MPNNKKRPVVRSYYDPDQDGTVVVYPEWMRVAVIVIVAVIVFACLRSCGL